MKICVFGDIHGQEIKIPRADLYLLTGDLSGLPEEDEMRLKKTFRTEINSPIEQRISFLKSHVEQKVVNRFINSAEQILRKFSSTGKPVFYVSGNREVIFDLIITQLNSHLETLEEKTTDLDNVKCIDSEIIELAGARILGIPFIPSKEWYIENYLQIVGFKSKFEQLRRVPRSFLNVKSDIVLSHCPPFGLVDLDNNSVNVGIKSLREYIDRNEPKYFFCGHIHEATGVEAYNRTKLINMGTSFYVFDL